MGATRRRTGYSSEVHTASEADEKFGFQTGPDFTFEEFQKYSARFKDCYFGLNDANKDSSSEGGEHKNIGDSEHMKRWEPTVEEIEGEYWRIVEQPTDEVEVRANSFMIASSFFSFFWR